MPIPGTTFSKGTNMSDTLTRNRLIAAKLLQLSDLFYSSASGGIEGTPAETPAEKLAKKPKKVQSETPAEDDTTATADHPKRAALAALAKEYSQIEGVGVAAAQKAMKLFGESSKLVPDAQLAGAIQHFKDLKAKAAALADETI